jgi:hypothetical protein
MIDSAFKSYTSTEAYRYFRFVHKEGNATTSQITGDLDKHISNVSNALNELASEELQFLQYHKQGRTKDYQLYLDGMFEWWRGRITDTADHRLSERGEQEKDFSNFKNSSGVRELFKVYVENYLNRNEVSTISKMLGYDLKYFVERYEDQLKEKGYGEAVEIIQNVYLYASESKADLKFIDNLEKESEVEEYR